MKILMWILPLAYVLGSLFFRIRKSYKEGLFCALLQLGNTLVVFYDKQKPQKVAS